MSSRDIAVSVLSGMLHCLLGSLLAGLLSASLFIALVRLMT